MHNWCKFHRNHHLLMSTFFNISLLVKYLVKDKIFEQHLGKVVKIKILLCDIFREDTTSISSRIVLENYLNCAKRNWQNINVQTNSIKDNDIDNRVKERVWNTKFDT